MQRLAILGEERTRVQKALAADRTEQDALNKQLGVASIGAAPDVFDEDIGRIRGELVTARTAHDEAAARLTSMDAGQGASSGDGCGGRRDCGQRLRAAEHEDLAESAAGRVDFADGQFDAESSRSTSRMRRSWRRSTATSTR